MSVREVRVLVRRHPPSGWFVAAVRESGLGARRLHVTEPHDDPRQAAITARVWARIHGFSVRYTVYEHGLVAPAAVGDFTVEAE